MCLWCLSDSSALHLVNAANGRKLRHGPAVVVMVASEWLEEEYCQTAGGRHR